MTPQPAARSKLSFFDLASTERKSSTVTDVELKAQEVEFFARQVDAAHARFLLAYFTNNRIGMKRFSEQYRTLYRRYNRATEEQAMLKSK